MHTHTYTRDGRDKAIAPPFPTLPHTRSYSQNTTAHASSSLRVGRYTHLSANHEARSPRDRNHCSGNRQLRKTLCKRLGVLRSSVSFAWQSGWDGVSFGIFRQL